MGTRSYYQVGIPSILEYYNIIGVDKDDIDWKSVVTEAPYLEEILCGEEHSYLPHECQKISAEWRMIIARLCEDFDYSSEGEELKDLYHHAVIHLLNVATSVNVIDEISNNYVLYFGRVNTLIHYVLAAINALDIYDVIRLSNILTEKDNATRIVKVYAFIKEKKQPYLFPMLAALFGNEESRDFEMFDEEKCSINFDKLSNMISASTQYASLQDISASYVYPRPSFRLCLKLTPKM